MKRRVNLTAILILLGGLVALGVGTYFLHEFQVKNQAGTLLAQADRAEEKKDLVEARDYLRRYLGFRPADSKVLTRYALLVSRDELATTPRATFNALTVLDSALLRDPDNTELRQQASRLSLRLYMHKEAAKHIEVLLKTDPDNGKLLGQLAECHLSRGDFPAARTAFERAIRHDPGEIDHTAGLANLLREHTDEVLRKDAKAKETAAALRKAADDLLEQYIKANPTSHKGYLARARFLRRYPLPAGADATTQAVQKDLLQAAQLAPDDAEVLLTLADMSADRREFDEARSLLARVKQAHPGEWRAYLALSRIERTENRPQVALVQVEEGIKVLPDQLELLWEEADLRVILNAPDAPKAIKNLEAKGFPQQERDILTARLRMRDGQWGEALKLLVAANSALLGRDNLARSPFSVSLLDQCNRLLTQCYLQLGDLQRAHTIYLRMVSRDPRSVEARFGVARTHAALGRTREAETQYHQLLAFPTGQYATVELARLALQRTLAQETKDWEEVNQRLEVASRLRPLPIEVTLLKAEALLGQNQGDKARELLEAQLIGGTLLPVGLIRPVAALSQPRQLMPVYIALSILEERAGTADKALALLDQGQARLGNLVEFQEARVRYFSRRGEAEANKGLAAIKQALPQYSTDEQNSLRRALALAYTRLNRPELARQMWQDLSTAKPDDWSACLVLFNQALERNDEKAMDELLAQLRKIENEDGVLWRDASIRKQLRKAIDGDKTALAEARRLTAEIAARWPSWVGVTLFEAQIDDLAGQHDRALQRYQTAIERGGANLLSVRRAAEILYAKQRFKEANALTARFKRLVEGSEDLSRLAAATAMRASDNAAALAQAERFVNEKSTNYKDHLFVAQVAWANRQFDKARASLALAQKLNPDAPEVWVLGLSMMVASDKLDDAKAELKKAESRLNTPAGRLALAQCYEIVGDRDKAGKLYTSPEMTGSPDFTVRRAVAMYHLRANDAKAARVHLQFLVDKATDKEPSTGMWARGMLAVLTATGGNYTETREELARLGGAESATAVSARRTRAVLLATRGNAQDRREAIQLFEALTDEGADLPVDRLMLAQLYEANNEWPKARKLFATMRKAPGGDSAEVLASFAQAMIRHDEIDAAEQAIEQLKKVVGQDNLGVLALRSQVLHHRGQKADAVKLLKNYAAKQGKSYGQVAVVLESLKEYAAAEEMYRAHTEKSPNPAALLAQAAFLGRRKRSKEAIDVCQRAWAKAPPNIVIDTCLGILEAADDDETLRERVEKQFQEYLSKEPKSPDIRLAMANLRVLQKQYDEAERLYRDLIAERRNDVLARNNLAWLLASQKQRLEEAEKLIADAIRAGGPLALLLDTQAVVYLANGDAKKAIRLLEDLVRDTPREATYHLHLAQAYARDNNRDSALRALDRAKKAGLEESALHPLERKGYDGLISELGSKQARKE